MLLFNKGESNEVIVTLAEKQTLESPIFLFVFKNEQSRIVSACIAIDMSAFTYRYNQFFITEKISPDPLNAEITLVDSGFYQYEIWEQLSDTNLNPKLATNLLESGKVKLLDTVTATPSFSSTQTATIFNG